MNTTTVMMVQVIMIDCDGDLEVEIISTEVGDGERNRGETSGREGR